MEFRSRANVWGRSLNQHWNSLFHIALYFFQQWSINFLMTVLILLILQAKDPMLRLLKGTNLHCWCNWNKKTVVDCDFLFYWYISYPLNWGRWTWTMSLLCFSMNELQTPFTLKMPINIKTYIRPFTWWTVVHN